MHMLEAMYTAGMHVARGIAPVLSGGESKLARGIRGRRGAVERFERWAALERVPGRPLAWFHAPSVGEGLQAKIVIEALRELRPDVQVAYTFFSPSAEPFAATLPVDVADYLPLDVPGLIGRVLDALDPGIIAFSKTEVWPNLTREASRRGIPTVLLSATLPESSSRLGRLARRFLSPTHARLARVAAITPDDAERFARLGVGRPRCEVMGDARFDQVWRRAHAPAGALLHDLRDLGRLTVVAGSTWPADEDRLIPAFAGAAAPPRRPRLIIVPHEPTEAHLSRVERRLAAVGLESVRLSSWTPAAPIPARDMGGVANPAGTEAGAPTVPVLLVDRVGVLGDLYALADVTYVGGGFGNAGLHSVLEPAAYGAPVIFGPNHDNAREAAGLIATGGGFSTADPHALGQVLNTCLADAGLRRAAGEAARGYVRDGLGAARRGAEIVIEQLKKSEE